MYPFINLVNYFKKRKCKNSKKRILIIDNAKIGDLICATPVFRAIKEKYPDSYLAVLISPKVQGILKNNKKIDKLIVYGMNNSKNINDIIELFTNIRSEKFNISVNLVPGNLNFTIPFVTGIPKRITTISKKFNWFYRLLSFTCGDRIEYKENYLSVKHYLNLLKPLGINNSNLKKEIFITDKAKIKAQNYFCNNSINKKDVLVGISLTAGNKIKEWGVENFSKLADLIIKKYNYKIILIGGVSDKEIIERTIELIKNKVIYTYKDFSLEEVPAVFEELKYFISVDTGPLYIANALDVPVLDIIGPCNQYDQAPTYEKCEIVFNENLICRPCSSVLETKTECEMGHLKCIKEISPEMVLNKFDRLIKKYG